MELLIVIAPIAAVVILLFILWYVTDGLKESAGIDLQSVLSGFVGAKLAEDDDKN